jgi:hypothetical protein
MFYHIEILLFRDGHDEKPQTFTLWDEDKDTGPALAHLPQPGHATINRRSSIFQNPSSASFPCKRNIEMTPLCQLAMTALESRPVPLADRAGKRGLALDPISDPNSDPSVITGAYRAAGQPQQFRTSQHQRRCGRQTKENFETSPLTAPAPLRERSREGGKRADVDLAFRCRPGSADNQGSRARLRTWEPGHRAADDRTRAHRGRDTTGTQVFGRVTQVID